MSLNSSVTAKGESLDGSLVVILASPASSVLMRKTKSKKSVKVEKRGRETQGNEPLLSSPSARVALYPKPCRPSWPSDRKKKEGKISEEYQKTKERGELTVLLTLGLKTIRATFDLQTLGQGSYSVDPESPLRSSR